jgi:hypothetical protein
MYPHRERKHAHYWIAGDSGQNRAMQHDEFGIAGIKTGSDPRLVVAPICAPPCLSVE